MIEERRELDLLLRAAQLEVLDELIDDLLGIDRRLCGIKGALLDFEQIDHVGDKQRQRATGIGNNLQQLLRGFHREGGRRVDHLHDSLDEGDLLVQGGLHFVGESGGQHLVKMGEHFSFLIGHELREVLRYDHHRLCVSESQIHSLQGKDLFLLLDLLPDGPRRVKHVFV